MDHAVACLLGPHCFFLRRDAQAAGLSDKTVYRLVRERVLHRIRHGAYTIREHWDGLDLPGRHLLLARCALRTAGAEVALSHTTAAVAHGSPVWGLPLHDVHLVRLDRRSGRREAGVRQHRHAIDRADVVEIDGMPVTSAARTCLDVTTISGIEVSLGVLDHFMHTAEVTKSELLHRCGELSNRPGSLASELACRLADGRSESVGETRVRYRCWASHLPHPVPQLEVWVRGRGRYRLDLAWPELGVWLEFDGKEKYLKHRRPGENMLDAVLREKRREEEIALETGWRCIRVTWADLYDPDRLVARIAAVLSGGPVHR